MLFHSSWDYWKEEELNSGKHNLYIYSARCVPVAGNLNLIFNEHLAREETSTVKKHSLFISEMYATAFILTVREDIDNSDVTIGRLSRMSVLDTEVDGSNPDSSMLFP